MVGRLVLLMICAATASPALAAELTVVNGTGGALKALGIRSEGSAGWSAIEGTISAGARRTLSSPGEQCLVDLRAQVPGGAVVTWSGLNFCEAKTVTLNRRSDGTTWADYD